MNTSTDSLLKSLICLPILEESPRSYIVNMDFPKFMSRYPFEKRRSAAIKLQKRHEGMVLLIIESPNFVFSKTNFVIQPENKLWEVMLDIKKANGFPVSEPMVAITYAGIVAPNTWTMAQLYSQYYSKDGFLYLKILRTDSAFG